MRPLVNDYLLFFINLLHFNLFETFVYFIHSCIVLWYLNVQFFCYKKKV